MCIVIQTSGQSLNTNAITARALGRREQCGISFSKGLEIEGDLVKSFFSTNYSSRKTYIEIH
jgi:hypothetical protein